jgi:hypothetical protein
VKISRADLAAYIIEHLDDPTIVYKHIFLAH